MGRFGNVWKSGRFSLNTSEEPLSKEVVSMMTDASPAFGLSDSSNVILSTLRTKRGLETGRWLNTLTTDLGATNERLTPLSQVEGSAYHEMIAWMDQMFQQFADLSFEFNKTAVNTDLLVTVEQPQLHDKNIAPNSPESGVKVYRGRLTTSKWALGVFGEDEKIKIHLIPAAMLLGFFVGQFTDEQFPPFMEIIRSKGEGKQGWTIGGQPATSQAVPYLAKELLGDLIRVASGVMSEAELLASSADHPKLGENVAVGYSHANNAPAPAPANGAGQSADSHAISEACDLVDSAVDSELKRLYEQVATLRPDSELATPTRKQISDLEKFRSKMLAAFEEYTGAHKQP